MFVLKRNQIIITALVVMVAVAGYLNYLDTGNSSTATTGIALNDHGEISALVPDLEYDDLSENEAGEIGSALTMDEDPAISIESEEVTSASATTDELSVATAMDPGTAVFVNTRMDSSYFVQAKLDREQVRSKQKEMLTDMINNSNIEQAQRAECASSLLEIQKRIEKESAAEAMIEAKGFSEVYVRIDDTTVDVVVNKEALTDSEIAQIEDIVKRKTGMAADQIRISTIKKQ